ncbi:MAG: glycosyltransferase family 1 protein [Candidatus Electrothrix sp. LOE2]|nr:glycosyltransferase family 1 protein [Candidatus Electrothrix sp. LOE2]
MVDKKIKVCNITEEGRFGGPARRIVQVAKALKPLGVDTHVVYPNLDSERFTQELSHAGVKATALNITRLTKEKKILARYIIRFPIEIIILCLFFRKHDFQLVHVNGSYQLKGVIAAKLMGIPAVWHLNDTGMDAIIKKISMVLAKYCASGFIVAGKRVRDFYLQESDVLEKKPVTEIHAPVDTVIFNPELVDSDERLTEADGTKILTVSGFAPGKGLTYFINMASILMQQKQNISFFIAGAKINSQKEYIQSLEQQIASSKLNDKILFLGLVKNVPAILKGADIVVITSLAEASPTVVWEAMSMGKAIVSTDVGSVNQYIEDGVSGLIVPIKDAKALSEKVQLLLDNPTLRQEMGAKARIVAQQHLDISIAAQKHRDFYQEIISSSTNSIVQ